MSPRFVASLFLTAILALNVTLSSAADPSLHQVYQAAEAGNFRAAQNMMDQVLRDHPNSAKAHFVEAELLAKQGKIASAKAELKTAERLDPASTFAKPSALQELNERLSPAPVSSALVSRNPIPVAEPAFPWGIVLVGIALVAALIYFLRRRQTPVTVIPASAGTSSFAGGFGTTPQPYGGGVGPMAPQAGGMGSGILGGLATGAALGAGMIAGEALMHRVLDGGHQASGNYIPADTSTTVTQPQYDMGGNDFGVSDSTSWDDSSGGGGGDDWG